MPHICAAANSSVACTSGFDNIQQQLGSADVKGVFVVEAEAAAQFMHDVSKANTAEAGLHLLAAVLGQQSASRDAVAATEANALQVTCSSSPMVPAVAVLGLGCLALLLWSCALGQHCHNSAEHTGLLLAAPATHMTLKTTVNTISQVASVCLCHHQDIASCHLAMPQLVSCTTSALQHP